MGLGELIKRIFRTKCKDAVLISYKNTYICAAKKTDCESFEGKKPDYLSFNSVSKGTTKYLICPKYNTNRSS